MKYLVLAFMLAMGGISSLNAAEKEVAPAGFSSELACIPADAIAFYHIRLADMWKDESFNLVRKLLDKAGAKTIEDFDKRFQPRPSSIDRLTFFILPPEDFSGEPESVIVLAFSKPIDTREFLRQSFPKAVEKKAKQGSYFAAEEEDYGIRFIDEKTVAYSDIYTVERWLNWTPKAGVGLASALKVAQNGTGFTIAVNPGSHKRELARLLREVEVLKIIHPLFQMQFATLRLDLKGDSEVSLSMNYEDAKQADQAELSIKDAKKLAMELINQQRKEMNRMALGDGKPTALKELPMSTAGLFGLAALQVGEEVVQDLAFKKEGATLSTSAKLPSMGKLVLISEGFHLAGIFFNFQESLRKTRFIESQNNLKQIGVAFHEYLDAKGTFPCNICDKATGNPLLSWRVAILPYIEQKKLYDQFKLNEPWNSEHNKKLIPLMPKIYAMPGVRNAPKGETFYRGPTGKEAIFYGTKGRKFTELEDGSSNVIMVVEAEQAVPWTKPDEFPYDPKLPIPKFSKIFKGANAILGDGSVRLIPMNTDERIIRAMITIAGGEGDNLP